MKKIIAGGIALVALVGGVYFGSPYYAANSLKDAAVAGDKDKLEASVDFPAVRESLKSQLSAAMMTEMQNDPEMRNNPFAGLGAVMMPAIIDRAIDAYVTPDGIASMVQGKAPADRTPSEAKNDIQSETEYVNIDRFRVKLHNSKLNEDGPSLLFERRGFASWKLIKLEMPPEMLKKKRVKAS